MRPALRALTALLLAVPAPARAQTESFSAALATIDTADLRAHTAFLASDRLRGRAPGTRGAGLAARYIASALGRAGAQPLNGSWYQRVPLVGIATAPAASRFELTGPRGPIAARSGTDFVAWSALPDTLLEDEAELVFVGYGVRAPEFQWDDYADADVAGRFVVVLIGDPPASFSEPALFDGHDLTYYGRWTYKVEEAARQGAAGVLLVHSPEEAGYGWDVVRSSWSDERLSLDHPATPRDAPLRAWISTSLARRIALAAGFRLADLVASAAQRGFRAVPLGVRLHASLVNRVRRFESSNVVGIIPGSDPQRRGEVVVYTAHYDHLGVGAAVDGDSIYNGAYDNASGVAVMLEIAGAFARATPPPQRSVLFMATTAEEAGLLGATWYVGHPFFPIEHTAAAINFDGANLWGETDDVAAAGAGQSTLGEFVQARARQLGLRVAPETTLDRGYFFRSDQFPFARAGVPSLVLAHGTSFRGRSLTWSDSVLAAYDSLHYHRPSDEVFEGADFGGAVQQARLGFLIGYDAAQAVALPVWNRGVRWGRENGFRR